MYVYQGWESQLFISVSLLGNVNPKFCHRRKAIHTADLQRIKNEEKR